MSSGPSIVLEIGSTDGSNVVESVRQFCGPADPKVAAAIRQVFYALASNFHCELYKTREKTWYAASQVRRFKSSKCRSLYRS